MNFKGAIFDMDGTLVDSLGTWEVMWRQVGEKFLNVKDFKPAEEIDKRVRTMIFYDAMAYFIGCYHLSCSTEELVAFTQRNIEDFYRYQAKTKSGAVALLEELRAKGIPLCLASATEMRYVRIALQSLDLAKYFCAVLSCADLGVGKDRPDVYLLAAKQLKLNAPDVCVFEDSFVALETSKRAGFQTVGIFDRYNFEQERLRAASDLYLPEGKPLSDLIPFFKIH